MRLAPFTLIQRPLPLLPPRLAMRRGQWKYFCEPDGNRAELFDLRQDPEERHNRVVENPEVANALNRELLAFFSTASREKGR